MSERLADRVDGRIDVGTTPVALAIVVLLVLGGDDGPAVGQGVMTGGVAGVWLYAVDNGQRVAADRAAESVAADARLPAAKLRRERIEQFVVGHRARLYLSAEHRS